MDRLGRLASAVETALHEIPFVEVSGVVREVTPTYYRVRGLSALVKLGDRVSLSREAHNAIGEVVRVDETAATVKPFDGRFPVGIGANARLIGPMRLTPSPSWKGRVINALGDPLDGLGPLPPGERAMSLDAEPPPALKRERLARRAGTGIRVIDIFTPICKGQRIGIFAGSGVGKSTILSMLAQSNGFDSVVLALVGERGREVRDFLEGSLSAQRPRAVAVVATGDESPMMRRLALRAAMSVAEYFRDAGESVLLIVDSITRYAHSARDIALAAGEPAVARGYAPSVFTDLPKILERAGPGGHGSGSITGIFAVLVDGDDHNDPVADAIRGTLDGHIVLDRSIADQGRYPAVNVLQSISRLADVVWTPEQRELVRGLKAMIAHYEDTRDLRLMGGYRAGSDADLDRAIRLVPRVYQALQQHPGAPPSADPYAELAQVMRA